METVVDSFLRLVQSFRESPLSFLIVLILIATLYFTYSQIEYIKEIIPNPAKESTQFQMSLKRDLVINDALENSLEYLNAKTVVVAQFHNGQYDLTRLPFTKISVTYAVGSNNMSQEELYAARPLSTMNHFMLDMWGDKEKPQCIASNTEDLKDAAYRLRQEIEGNKFVSICPITNLLNYPIGYLAIGYGHQPKPEEIPELLNYERLMTARIAGYLQEGVVVDD